MTSAWFVVVRVIGALAAGDAPAPDQGAQTPVTPTWLPIALGFTGAFIGGAALLAVYFLTRQEARRQHRLEVRREAYAEMYSACASVFRMMSLRANDTGADPQRSRDITDQGAEAIVRASAARGMVEIVAPSDTGRAAILMLGSLDHSVQDMKALQTAFASTRAEFIALAKRDLGLDQPELSYRQRLAERRGLGWLAKK